MKPTVLIQVSGGVADWSQLGDVNVVKVDWDDMEASDLETLKESLLEVVALPNIYGKDQALKDLSKLIAGYTED